MHILLVEDDPELAQRIAARLTSAGFSVDRAASGEDAQDWPDVDQMAAIILDLGLPNMSGMEVLETWRRRKLQTPVIILTARGSWQEKVEGLNAGADDFVVKPVRSEELIARLHAVIRRAEGQSTNTIRAGRVVVDPAAKTAMLDGKPLSLSKQEFRLLQLFASRPGHILSQSDILNHLYALDEERDLNTVEVHVSRLRRKIGREAIVTIRGLGYRLNC
ncbi:MAG: response regulator transcription factor [Parasphingopyxis sp.]